MEDSRIKVIDSYMGSGKTSWAINYINSLDADTKVIYITPFLNECDRIIKSCRRNFMQPDIRQGRGRKMTHLIQLVVDGENIASTHALFANIDDSLINALRAHEYILVLDESMSVVENFDLYNERMMMGRDAKQMTIRQDILNLKDSGYLEIEEDYSIRWIGKELGKYITLKKLADRGLLYFINDSLLIWSFPIEVFRRGIFSEIYILTYQFDYQIQSLYYNYFGLNYTFHHIETKNGEYQMLPTLGHKNEREWKERIKELITIDCSTKLNHIGSIYYNAQNHRIDTSLSKNWYNNNPDLVDKVAKNMTNFFLNVAKSKANERLWTCYKPDINKLKRKNLSTRQWLEVTSRATNDYGDRTALAYVINRYPNPFFDHFFQKRGLEINKEGFALSEMVQWVWRSAIRNEEPIHLYVPSERMRNIFIDWLNNEPINKNA